MDRASLEQSSFHGKARTQFLANLPDIKKALEDGYPAAAVWRELRKSGAFDAKYAQFMIYVTNYVYPKKKPTEPLKLNPSKQSIGGKSVVSVQDQEPSTAQQAKTDQEPVKRREPFVHKQEEQRTMRFMDMNIDGMKELLKPYKDEDDFKKTMEEFEAKRNDATR